MKKKTKLLSDDEESLTGEDQLDDDIFEEASLQHKEEDNTVTDADKQLDSDDNCNHSQVRMGQLYLNEQHDYNLKGRYDTSEKSLYNYGETQLRQV